MSRAMMADLLIFKIQNPLILDETHLLPGSSKIISGENFSEIWCQSLFPQKPSNSEAADSQYHAELGIWSLRYCSVKSVLGKNQY